VTSSAEPGWARITFGVVGGSSYADKKKKMQRRRGAPDSNIQDKVLNTGALNPKVKTRGLI